jgi:hypothetical protein
MQRYTRILLGRLTPALVVAGALFCASPAAAQSNLDRIQVGIPHTVTRAFATNLSLRLNIPSGFTRDCCYDFKSGAWVGPAVHYASNPGRTDLSRVAWEVHYSRTSRSLASVARAAGWAHYAQVSVRRRTVRHVLSGRRLGKLRAYSATDQQDGFATTQAALVIDLGRHVKATILFTFTDPQTDADSSGGGVTVNGLAASAWNLHAAELALKSIELEGPLPISRVRASARGHTITGSVTDIAGDALGQAKLALQRRAGGWHTLGKTRSSLGGTFSVTVPHPGQYRVVATLTGRSVRSRPVTVR